MTPLSMAPCPSFPSLINGTVTYANQSSVYLYFHCGNLPATNVKKKFLATNVFVVMRKNSATELHETDLLSRLGGPRREIINVYEVMHRGRGDGGGVWSRVACLNFKCLLSQCFIDASPGRRKLNENFCLWNFREGG